MLKAASEDHSEAAFIANSSDAAQLLISATVGAVTFAGNLVTYGKDMVKSHNAQTILLFA